MKKQLVRLRRGDNRQKRGRFSLLLNEQHPITFADMDRHSGNTPKRTREESLGPSVSRTILRRELQGGLEWAAVVVPLS